MTDRIPEGWRECKLADVVNILPGFAFKSEHFGNEGIPVIKITDINPPYINVNDAMKVDLTYYDSEKLEKYKISKDDFVIAMTGATIGKIGRLNENITAIVNQRVAKIVPKESTDKKFVYYSIHGEDFQTFIQNNIDSNSAQENISGTSISRYSILLPPFHEQRAIASVLGSLDDKIDLLNRENQTLEQMAEALFRQWFIEEADEKWEQVPLDQIADYLNGLACQKYPPKNDFEKLPVLKIRELRNGSIDGSDWATTDVPKEYIVQNGDVIFSWSGSLLVKMWDGAKCVLNQHLFKVTSERYPKWFYYLWTIHHINKFISIAEGKATTMGHIKREDLSSSIVLIPNTNEFKYMDKVISPLIEKIILNNSQIRTLEKLRDTLLPKLMSGEVRVKICDA